jgi:SAM-dependent methyltransferase
VTEVESEAGVRTVYDAVADDYADYFPSTEPEQRIELAMVEHFGSLLPPRSRDVLDAGCGAGRMLPVLAAAGCRSVGMDLSAGMIRRAQRDHPEFQTCVGSITALPFANGSFDGVFYWFSIIHIPDHRLRSVFEEARRVLRPGGHVLVAFQGGEGVRDAAQGYRRRGHDVVLHRRHRSPEHVADELRVAGFAEVARLVRRPVHPERDDQVVIVAHRT